MKRVCGSKLDCFNCTQAHVAHTGATDQTYVSKEAT